MYYFIQRFSTFLVLSIFLLAPFTSFAQVSTTTSIDGSNDSTTTRRDYIRGWRQGSSDIQQKINALSSTSTFSVFMPVLFGVELSNISPNFGDPRSGGRTHAGEDIMAVKGTPIVSPTPAVVLRTGVGVGEGNYVYTANPGGETFVYIHLDRFGEGVVEGMILEQGSLIGYVGNTGNASGGASHLHFEIHNSSGIPVDPYPRLLSTFTLQEKINYLNKILTQTSNANDLSQFLVTNFRQTFNNALSSGIVIPQIITNFLASLPVTTPSTFPEYIPAGDLTLGSSGSLVVTLQKYLIAKNVGSQALRLSQAGATGNFGPITEGALAEYQASIGISPANGYYGLATKIFIDSNPLPSTTTGSIGNTNFVLTRNLYNSISGQDVLILQKFLNTNGFIVSAVGAGSINNETTYFGNATQSAVIRFQIAHNISPAVGYVGPITRSILTSLGI